MNVNTIISGDYTNLTLWKLVKKSEKKHKKKVKNFSFDLIDYNKNKYEYYYEIYREISISSSATSLLNIDNQTFISAHYGPSIVTFYNIWINIYHSFIFIIDSIIDYFITINRIFHCFIFLIFICAIII